MKYLSIVMLFFVFLNAAHAAPGELLQLHNTARQGGILAGTLPTGARLSQDGQAVPVAPDGSFVLGIAYNAQETLNLTITLKNGETQQQRIPVAATAFSVQRVEGLAKDKVSPNPRDTARIQADQAAIRSKRSEAAAKARFRPLAFVMPAEGRLSGVFGSQRILNGEPRQPHFGIDVAAPTGTPFVSPADGIVVLASTDFFLLGGTIMVDHGYGITSVFAHANSVAVKAGDVVRRGDTLGTIGKTGRATGPHLHWGTAVGAVNVDPQALLELFPAAGN